jgi:GTP cyclohydrolase II
VIFDDIKTKSNVIEEGAKRNKELQVRLHEYAEMYDVLKAERNKCVSHIQTTTQVRQGYRGVCVCGAYCTNIVFLFVLTYQLV